MNRRDFLTTVGSAAVMAALATSSAEAAPPSSEEMSQRLHHLQERLGFNDAQFKQFLQQPRTGKILKRLDAVRSTPIVFEVVQAEGCMAGQRPGDRYIFPGGASLDLKQSTPRLCPFLMPPITRMMAVILERIWEGLDPIPLFAAGHCDDVGLACNGWGRVVIEAKRQTLKMPIKP